MIKLFLTLFLPLIIIITTNAQTISYEDFKNVIPYLQKEDFKEAYKITSSLLKSTINDSSDLRAIVIYMNIFSASGMVTLNQMTHNEFKKNTKNFIGQYIVMSAHPCVDSSANSFNSIKFTTNENGELEGMTVASNKDMTNILCF